MSDPYTNDRPLRTTTRSQRTAEAIRDLVPFNTSGSLMGRTRNPERSAGIGGPWNYGNLTGLDFEQAREDDAQGNIDYVVWSYSTPIAWHRTDGTWHIVAQTFSPTTTKHQGNLYLTNLSGDRTWPRRKWCGMKGGVNRGYDLIDNNGSVIAHADDRDAADFLARFIMLNGLPSGTSMNGVTVP